MNQYTADQCRVAIKNAIDSLEGYSGEVCYDAAPHILLAMAQVQVALAQFEVAEQIELHRWDEAE